MVQNERRHQKAKARHKQSERRHQKEKARHNQNESPPKEEPEMIFFYDMDELKELVTKHKIGWIVEYNTENQMGTLIYKIVKKSGKKTAEIIGDYDGLYN